MAQSSVRVERGSPCWANASHQHPEPGGSAFCPASPRSRRGDGWDPLADIKVFVFAVEAELEAMERERVGVHRRGRRPDLTLRRCLIGLIWTLTFGGNCVDIARGSQELSRSLSHEPMRISRRVYPLGSGIDR